MSKIEKVLATGKTHTTVSAAGNTSGAITAASTSSCRRPETRNRRTCSPLLSHTRPPSNCSLAHGRPATPPPSGWWQMK